MKTTDIEYSIILPCLNEEKTLGICIRKIHQFFSNTGLTYEIIVADNGSTDNSALVAKNNRADVIQVSQKGYGSALRHGIEHCNGKYIIMGDADDSYNFLELSLFIERLQAGNSGSVLQIDLHIRRPKQANSRVCLLLLRHRPQQR